VSTTTKADTGRRKLIAVLYADMVGYSRLIGLDDSGTLERLRNLRRNLIDPAIEEHGGRIVQTGGDSLLVTFDSIDGAVRCALDVQRQVPIHDRDQPRDRTIRFRVGINIGDAIADGTDLHGDAVNVAARLQAECPPGGICVSRSVRDHVHGRLDLSFEPLGALDLKNISRPVEAFLAKVDEMARPKDRKGAVIPPPDRPSIAVLPFQNMSGDPEQEYLADGIVEEIITGLTRIQSFHVIARTSSFGYKGKSPDVRQAGTELGARYILEGSVRKAAGRVRITGQLIDAESGAHLWADRFEGNLTDIFQLQDRVMVSVVGMIEPRILAAEIQRALRKPTENLEAYDLVLRARWTYETRKASLEEAASLCRRAIALDANYALAYALLARILFSFAANQFSQPSEAELAELGDLARNAVRLGPTDTETLCLAGLIIALPGGDLAEGIAIVDRALSYNPNSAEALTISGALRAYAGDTETALRDLNEAIPLAPPGVRQEIGAPFGLCLAYFVAGDYTKVLDWTAEELRQYPTRIGALRYRIAALRLLGRFDEARQAVDRILALNQALTISRCRRHIEVEMKNPFKRPGVVEAYYKGLRLAGLLE
jgi:adenylate cyclase